MPHCNKKMISFFLTTKCNLCCHYCYNADERNSIEEQTIPIEIAKAGIDWYFSTNESRHIRFYGPGEPTQEFEKLKEITEYAKAHENRGEDVTVFGNKTSAEVLESNVKWLIENKGDRNLMVGARVTITDINIDKQIEMVDYFYGLGIRYVWTNPLFYGVGQEPVCKDEKKRKEFHFDMDGYLDNYLIAYEYAKAKGLFWGSFLTINFDGESEYHCRCCTPLSAPHLTTDGYISACDMALNGSTPSHMKLFIVGKWNETTKSFDFENDKIKALNERKSTNMTHCQKCPAKLHCGGQCLGETVNETGRLDGQNFVKCKAVRYLFDKLGTCNPYPFLHP